jgi:hypothetical protein
MSIVDTNSALNNMCFCALKRSTGQRGSSVAATVTSPLKCHRLYAEREEAKTEEEKPIPAHKEAEGGEEETGEVLLRVTPCTGPTMQEVQTEKLDSPEQDALLPLLRQAKMELDRAREVLEKCRKWFYTADIPHRIPPWIDIIREVLMGVPKEDNRSITARLPQEMADQFERSASDASMSKSDYLRMIVREHFWRWRSGSEGENGQTKEGNKAND